MFRLRYSLKGQIVTRTFYNQRMFQTFLNTIKRSPEVTDIAILPTDMNLVLREVS